MTTTSEPLLLEELKAALKAKGLTHVLTFGPTLTIDEWNPYGQSPGGVNYREGFRPYRGEIIEKDGKHYVRDHDADCELRQQCNLILGIWEFVTKEGP